MTTMRSGRQAEDRVADYLQSQGYTIVDRNWRTRWCEIDIIARKKSVVYFVEVKYRQSGQWGDGLDAITRKKQQQMAFAAEFWLQAQNWASDSRLMAVSVSGADYEIDAVVEL